MNDGTISNLSAPPVIGLVWIAVAVTFGIRRPGGALLAGLAFGGGSQLVFTWIGNDFLTGGLHDLITSPYFTTMLFGLGAINLAQNPDGLLAIIGTQKAEKRREKARRAHLVAAEAELHGDEQAAADALEGRVEEAERAVESDEAAASRARQLGIVQTDGQVTAAAAPDAEQRDALARRHRRRVRPGGGAARRVRERRARRGRRAPRRQRRREVDAVRGGRRAGRTDVGAGAARRHRRHRRDGGAPGAGGHAARARGPRHLPRA